MSPMLWVVIVAQSLAIGWVNRPWITGDSATYLKLADGLAHGFYGTSRLTPDVLRPPGYPVLLYLLVERGGLPVALIIAVQLGIYLLSLALIDRWLKRRNIDPFVFRLLAAIYPFAAAYSANLMTEAWVGLALTVMALVLADEKFTIRQVTLVSAIAGLATLFRVDFLLVPVLVGGLIVWRAFKTKETASWFAARAVAVVLPAALVLLPYSIWNYSHFGRLSPVPRATAFGNSLYLSYWQEILPLSDLVSFYSTPTEAALRSGWAGEVRQINRSIGAPVNTSPDNPANDPDTRTQIASSPAFLKAAIGRIEANPLIYAKHVVKNIWLLWNTTEYPASLPRVARYVLVAISYGVWAFGMLGAFLTFFPPKEWPAKPTMALLMLYPWAVHLPMHLEARYTATARPLLLLFASLSIIWVVRAGLERRRSDRCDPAMEVK